MKLIVNVKDVKKTMKYNSLLTQGLGGANTPLKADIYKDLQRLLENDADIAAQVSTMISKVEVMIKDSSVKPDAALRVNSIFHVPEDYKSGTWINTCSWISRGNAGYWTDLTCGGSCSGTCSNGCGGACYGSCSSSCGFGCGSSCSNSGCVNGCTGSCGGS